MFVPVWLLVVAAAAAIAQLIAMMFAWAFYVRVLADFQKACFRLEVELEGIRRATKDDVFKQAERFVEWLRLSQCGPREG